VAHFSAKFSADANFGFAKFSADANFGFAKFSSLADFGAATFKDYVRFAGGRGSQVFDDNASMNLQFAKIEKPDRLSFHTLALRPRWFVNVDARKFEFINVDWNWRDTSTKQEINSIGQRGDLAAVLAHRLLAVACRNLALNAEENHRYEEASRFRYMAMEARRLERWRGFAFWTLGWWYWLASGYGERVWRAFVVLSCVWLVAAALYTRVGFARWEPRVSTEQEAAEARRDEVGEPLRLPRSHIQPGRDDFAKAGAATGDERRAESRYARNHPRPRAGRAAGARHPAEVHAVTHRRRGRARRPPKHTRGLLRPGPLSAGRHSLPQERRAGTYSETRMPFSMSLLWYPARVRVFES
jgi:hypothetical protein